MQRTLQWLYAGNDHRNLANMSVTACRVCGANYYKYSVAWILSSCHKSLAKVFTGTMAMAVSVYAPANVSYSAPNKDACLLIAPIRSKFCQLDVNWTFSWAGRSLRNWAFWFHSVSLVPWFRIHLSLNSTIFVAKSWELIPKVKEWFEYSLYEYFGNLQEARCFPAQTNFFYSIWIVFNSTKLNSRHFVFGELWVKTYNTNITVSEYIQSIEIGRCRIEICRKVPI